MTRYKTFADVHRALSGPLAPLKREVAAQMGVRPETFSRMISDWDGKPTTAWVARFEDALEAINGIQADR